MSTLNYETEAEFRQGIAHLPPAHRERLIELRKLEIKRQEMIPPKSEAKLTKKQRMGTPFLVAKKEIKDLIDAGKRINSGTNDVQPGDEQ